MKQQIVITRQDFVEKTIIFRWWEDLERDAYIIEVSTEDPAPVETPCA